MGFGIGSNDASNSWGTAVGSAAISLPSALIIGAIMEWLGAVLLGHGVADTLQKGVAPLSSPDCWSCGFCDSKMSVYLICMLAALLSASIFLLIATFTAYPVSTTHAIVGAVVGGTIVGTNWSCLNWNFNGGLSGIIASWVISPLLSGVVAAGLWILLRRTVIDAPQPLQRARIASPLIYAGSIFLIVFMILLKSKVTKGRLSRTSMVVIALFIGAAAGFLSNQYILPRIQKTIERRRALRDRLHLAEANDADDGTDPHRRRPGSVELTSKAEDWSDDASATKLHTSALSVDGPQHVERLTSVDLRVELGHSHHRSVDARGDRPEAVEATTAFSHRHVAGGPASGGDVALRSSLGGRDLDDAGPTVTHDPHYAARSSSKARSSDPVDEDELLLASVAKTRIGRLWLNFQATAAEKAPPPQASRDATHAPGGNQPPLTEDQQDAILHFRYLLVLVAALEAFAHGANDSSNAASAFAAAVSTYKGSTCGGTSTPVWYDFFFFFFGGGGLCRVCSSFYQSQLFRVPSESVRAC